MGMYTYFTFDGTVKEKYREPMFEILSRMSDESPYEKVKRLGLTFLEEFAKGERAGQILYGARCEDECSYKPETGVLHIECDIKNYYEENPDGTRRPKNSSQLFIEALPELFDNDKKIAYSLFFEEDEMAVELEYINGEWVQTNREAYVKAWNEAHPYPGRW
jgi:hypothetical protein